jgi:hypothetical protein
MHPCKKIKSLRKRIERWVKQLTSRPTPSNSKTYLDTNGCMDFKVPSREKFTKAFTSCGLLTYK